MKPIIHSHAVLRIPALPINATLPDHWDSLKQSICHSSAEFYRYIENIDGRRLDEMPSAVAYTVWKYFNRARYRPVPYGNFAGIADIELGKNPGGIVRIAEEHRLHHFVDWMEKAQIAFGQSEMLDADLKLFANSSYYEVDEAIRYISFFDKQYQLSAVDSSAIVMKILSLCAKPLRYSLLMELLENHGLKKTKASHVIEWMIAMQLLISSTQPNIIGEDYFERLNIPSSACSKYLIAERPVLSGTIDKDLFQHVPELTRILAGVIEPAKSTLLVGFIKQFSIRYADREIPLMLALDPECGLGYGDLESPDEDQSLAAKFAYRQSSESGGTELRNLLLGQVARDCAAPLDLEKIIRSSSMKKRMLPNSMNVLLSLGDEMLFADAIGSCTATALMARFTLASEQITEQCRKIAELEAAANPGVLFFDIGYTGEGIVDNINRRRDVYASQLSILNYDTSAEPLCLSDMFISVQGEEIVLLSRRLNKRLVPRLASAYNYTRSDLPLFRFLCDLQSHGLHCNMAIDLQELIPGLDRYPRLYYKNIVLSPAKWKVDSVAQLPSPDKVRYFLSGPADQTLCFDQSNYEDMMMFERYLLKHGATYIREAFVDRNSRIRDGRDSPYQAQVLLNLVHGQQVYQGMDSGPVVKRTEGAVQVVPPGMDWIYFEIYCHWNSADQLLTGPIAELLNKYSSCIKKWFFIRYTENGHHIRLRLKLENRMFSQPITEGLSVILSGDLDSGKVSNLLLNTYKRETRRYIGNDIRDIEAHFCCDSTFVLSFLSAAPSVYQKYALCEVLLGRLKTAQLLADGAFMELIYQVAEAYNEEHKINNQDFKEINASYKEYIYKKPGQILKRSQQIAHKRFLNSFLSVVKMCKTELRGKLIVDLIHMHFNRLFPESQRGHEMIFYNFLIKNHKKQQTC